MWTRRITRGRANRLFVCGVLALAVASCLGLDTQSLVETSIAQTQQISGLQTAAAGANSTVTPDAQDQIESSPAAETAALFIQSSQPPTPEPTQPAWNWNGVWNVRDGNNLFKGALAVNDNFITGVLDCNWDGCLEQLTIHGMLINGGQVASGTLELASGGEGPFQWQMYVANTNQFVGNYTNGAGQFCGWRDGASEPSPCKWP